MKFLKIAAISVAAFPLAFYACSASGSAHGRTRFDVPFSDDDVIVDGTISIGEDEGTLDIEGGADHANMCVSVTWTDSEGNEISTEVLGTDGSGHASGKIPKGAVRWEAVLVDCPVDAGGIQRLTAGTPGVSSLPTGERALSPHVMREFLILGGPLIPSSEPGSANLCYSFVVRAETSVEAHTLVDPILAGGPGMPIHPAVTVVSYATMAVTASGGHLTAALPGHFEAFALDFNDGAFQTALGAPDLLVHEVGGWSVAETIVPLAAFEFGFAPGATYSNWGEATYRTNLLPETTTSHQYGYTY